MRGTDRDVLGILHTHHFVVMRMGGAPSSGHMDPLHRSRHPLVPTDVSQRACPGGNAAPEFSFSVFTLLHGFVAAEPARTYHLEVLSVY